MKLFVGLGNPGEKHQNNRHNVGYLFIDEFKKKLPKNVLAFKTNVFMNTSGEAVKALVNKYKVAPEDLFVVHDDLDIALGLYKIQEGKGPKLHNGIASIEKVMQTTDFNRVRVGVDNRKEGSRTPGEEYVLEDFTPEERAVLEGVFKKIILQITNGN